MLKQLVKIILIFGLLISTSSVFARLMFLNDVPYTSAFYTGIQGGYVLTKDTSKYKGTVFPYKSKDQDLDSFGAGVFIGYGHVIAHGNLPYFGGEIGGHYRSNFDSGVYGAKINANWAISADLMPGFFLDEGNTTLVYIRVGVEGEQFGIKGGGVSSDHKDKILYRAGAGIEHQVIGHLYARLDYVFASPAGRITFKTNLGEYSSNLFFNTFTVGLSYRF